MELYTALGVIDGAQIDASRLTLKSIPADINHANRLQGDPAAGWRQVDTMWEVIVDGKACGHRMAGLREEADNGVLGSDAVRFMKRDVVILHHKHRHVIAHEIWANHPKWREEVIAVVTWGFPSQEGQARIDRESLERGNERLARWRKRYPRNPAYAGANHATALALASH